MPRTAGPDPLRFIVPAVPQVPGFALQSSLFRSIPWFWVLVWLVLPGLVVMLTWPIGGPPMGRYWLGMGAIALVASQLPWLRVRRLLLSLLTLAMAVVYVSKTFNITIYNYELLLPFLLEVKPLRSPDYVIGGAVVLAALVAGWIMVPRVPRFAGPKPWLLGLLIVLGVTMIDNGATASTAGSYQGLPDPRNPFSSAVRQAGVEQPGKERRHLVIVLVEALGNPAGAEERRLFEADWNRPEWRQRYTVTSGVTPYYGSTTSAEMRELCSQWADYLTLDIAAANCLPKRYAAAGYQTTGWHAFPGWFFSRYQWWPKLGLAERNFAERTLQAGAKPCGGVFPGACDNDIPGIIGQRIKDAKQPQLHYWVTLNSHLPVLDDPSLGTTDCDHGGAVLADGPPMLCRIFVIHHQLANAITAMAMDPKLPPTDILIVGDHMPPFFQRKARERFDGDKVPWVFLRAK